MAKKKLVDKVRSKRRKTESKVNPFEVKFNRQKHEILGRKISKFDKGLPGLSRSKALKKVNIFIYQLEIYIMHALSAYCMYYLELVHQIWRKVNEFRNVVFRN